MGAKSKKDIAATLAAATCSLLGTSALSPVQAQEDPGWDFNTALLYYGESDNRVEDLSLNILARRAFHDDRSLDGRFRIPFGARAYLEPHLRFYTQTEADFYRASPTGGEPLPLHAASDYRLGRFDAITAGLKYGF